MTLSMKIPGNEFDAYEKRAEEALREHWIANEEANRPEIKMFIQDLAPDKRPCIVVGAGWTLDSNIEKLKTVPDRKKYCLIACDKAVPMLLPFWKPDYIVSLNATETDATAEKYFNFDSTGVRLVMPVTVHPSVHQGWKGEKVWLLPSNISTDLKEQFADRYDIDPIYRGTNSGFFALVVAGLLGCNPIAIIGMTLCIEGLGPYPAMGEWRVITTDPFKNLVNTHLEWFSARTEMIELIERLQNNVGVTVFNCSEGGILYTPGIGLSLYKFLELEIDG